LAVFASDYQALALRTAGNRTPREGLVAAALGLNGEAGEVADLVKKVEFHGHELDEAHLKEELGDVTWYIALACDSMGWDFGDIMRGNLEKLARRYPQGFSTEASIARVDKAS
jgi:NTP pyrophosphatase (non-canonical NTP hydrolase)